MYRFLAHRIILMFGILAGVMLLTFILSRMLPGSPVEMMLGHRPTPEQIALARAELGLDKPVFVQFFYYLGNLVQGDWGMSLRTGRPVIEDLGMRFGATFELTTLALIIVVTLGIPLGVLSAVKQNSMLDHITRTGSIAGMALPVFLIGMLLQMLFYGKLSWFPLQGRIHSEVALDFSFDHITGLYLIDTLLGGQWVAFKSAAHHLVLPVASLAIASIAVVTRITRNTMVEVLGEDHIKTLRAYGIPAHLIYYRYALKATLIPLLTVIGLTYGYMLGGSVVIEYVFDWPGMGSYVVGAITQSDYPAVLGVTILLATIYLTINLIIDLLYQFVDPRLKVA